MLYFYITMDDLFGNINILYYYNRFAHILQYVRRTNLKLLAFRGNQYGQQQSI